VPAVERTWAAAGVVVRVQELVEVTVAEAAAIITELARAHGFAGLPFFDIQLSSGQICEVDA
jgi:hypothetical protein